MKKIFLLSFILICLINSVFAQANEFVFRFSSFSKSIANPSTGLEQFVSAQLRSCHAYERNNSVVLVSPSLFTNNIAVDYLKKSKNQKAGAWLLLGGGALVFTITSASASSNLGIGTANKRSSSAVPACIGGAMMVGSIPLFISSAKNKRKAMNTSLVIKMTKAVVQYHLHAFTNYEIAGIRIDLH